MRIALPILIGLLAVAGSAFAVNTGTGDDALLFRMAELPNDGSMFDVPIRGNDFGLRADTAWYGQFYEDGGEYYAYSFNTIEEGSWTFDRGTGPPPGRGSSVIPDGEGWTVRDQSANENIYWKVIDSNLNLGEAYGQPIPAPVINGNWSLWCGADDDESNDLCWQCDAGYGDDWCQRVYSPKLDYAGTGDVLLQCYYFTQSEPCFDGTQIWLRRQDSSELMINKMPEETCENNLSWTGGTWQDSIGHYTNPMLYTRTILAAELEGTDSIQIIFEFTSDGAWSDVDCQHPTIWGPVGIDDISITGVGIDQFYNFESRDFMGWTPAVCDPIGAYAGIADMTDCYTILDPCVCRLENNVLELHDLVCDEGVHPVGQSIRVESPICWFGNTDLKTIFMQFDMYSIMPLENGVLHRPGWSYYPWVCEETGAIGWSPRVGQDSWNYVGTDPVCGRWRYGGTTISAGIPVPADAEGVKAYIELLGDCEAFGIENCSGVTNFTPIYDNLTVAQTVGINAPIVDFDIGGQFQDVGSYPSILFDPMAPGPANCTWDVKMDTPYGVTKDYCGDSLVVTGPQPGSDPNKRWNAKLWWRVSKRAPFQADTVDGVQSRYALWRETVADGKDIDHPVSPEFTWGLMDTVQVGFVVTRNKFMSTFHEDDDDFGPGEGEAMNEMIWDDVLYPGSEIEYFVTAFFTVTPNDVYLLPDTTGGNFREFAVLPGLRTVNVAGCGESDYCVFQPAILYIDAFESYDRGRAQFFVENALASILNDEPLCVEDAGCEIPKYRNWDRYDYGDPSSNWNAPFVRGTVAESNNGMTLNQILGYRGILVNTGGLGDGCMQDEDFGLFAAWLTEPACGANTNSQFFHMNGDKAGQVLMKPGGEYAVPMFGPPFMNFELGATLYCEAFNGYVENANCAPESDQYCVRWQWSGDPAGFPNAIDVDAWGSYCPNLYGFNILHETGTGFGNRVYNANINPNEPTKYREFGQILNEDLSPSANYRTALDGVSWHRMTAHDPLADPTTTGPCPRTTASIVAGSYNEICEALTWGFRLAKADCKDAPRLASAKALATCQNTWQLIPDDVDEGDVSFLVNRLFQNKPNPFNPTTTIQFSLAQVGKVEVSIYDVNGRLVKTLVDGKKDAGVHSVVWNGTNNLGNKVGSGVYWSKMRTEKFTSNKQMVILK